MSRTPVHARKGSGASSFRRYGLPFLNNLWDHAFSVSPVLTNDVAKLSTGVDR